jgi:hypothetical protein
LGLCSFSLTKPKIFQGMSANIPLELAINQPENINLFVVI